MMNIAELLKDCPRGMELNSTMYDNLVFCRIDSEEQNYPIITELPDGMQKRFTSHGRYDHNSNAKCVIFPKGKNTWRGFIPPREFKDGDIVATTTGNWIGITTGGDSGSFMPTYCVVKSNGEFEAYFDHKERWKFDRFATEEERQKLFNAIQDNGYKWDEETKTLDKLAPNKFDVTALIPFESKVLVRDKNTDEWRGHFFSHYDNSSDRPYVCIGVEGINEYKQCIPYKDNEHLLGKTDDCGEYYKNW